MRNEFAWITPVAAALLLMGLAGCSPQSGTRERLSSELRVLSSLASESELFIGQIQEGKLTNAYAHSYASYLADSVHEEAEKLRQTTPAAGLERPWAECEKQ